MLEILEYFGLACIPAFMFLDAAGGSRSYRTPRFWRLRGIVVTLLVVAGSFAVAMTWAHVLGDFHLFDLSDQNTFVGAVIGLVVYEFFHYWYHRIAHAWTPLWRHSHQMHHSTEAIDAFGAYYLHPIDIVFFTTWSSLVFYPLLGLAPEAGGYAAAYVGFSAMFQHANIKTPHWLGYVIQRPESHCVHHARGQHRQNYADLPLWDIVFGTFDNPRSVEGVEAGFYNGASTRIGAMLIGRDVSTPPADPGKAADRGQRQWAGSAT
jgi:sterol desaturase/sphingolipid hydroxylase (fatty acid hydroxylase superfamily)